MCMVLCVCSKKCVAIRKVLDVAERRLEVGCKYTLVQQYDNG